MTTITNSFFKLGTETGVVNSWNEWDQLEEIIVGVCDKAVIPPREPAFEVLLPLPPPPPVSSFEILLLPSYSLPR